MGMHVQAIVRGGRRAFAPSVATRRRVNEYWHE